MRQPMPYPATLILEIKDVEGTWYSPLSFRVNTKSHMIERLMYIKTSYVINGSYRIYLIVDSKLNDLDY